MGLLAGASGHARWAQAKRESHDRAIDSYAQAINESDEFIVVINSDHDIVAWSSGAEKKTGYSLEEVERLGPGFLFGDSAFFRRHKVAFDTSMREDNLGSN